MLIEAMPLPGQVPESLTATHPTVGHMNLACCSVMIAYLDIFMVAFFVCFANWSILTWSCYLFARAT